MKYFITIIGFLTSNAVSAQHFSISNDRNNVLYAGIDNPITIVVENIPPTQIIVKADKGDIKGNGTKFVYRGDDLGIISIILFKKNTLKEIGRSNFRLKYIPNPVPKVGPSSGGNIRAIVLKSQKYIRAELEYFDIDVRYNIDSFTLNIIRPDTCFFNEIKSFGNVLSKEISEALNTIRKNDIVIFKDIYTTAFDRRPLLLAPILFSITD